jgi:hypothetical protein
MIRNTMDSDIPGKYIHEKNPSQYVELKPGGNCFLFVGSAGVTGTYEVHEGELTLHTSGSTSKATIQDGVITDEEGDRWILAGTTEKGSTGTHRCPKCNSEVLANARFCSSCGYVLAGGQAPGSKITGDQIISSVPWLAQLVGKNLPWELYEAIGWAAVLILLLVG